MSRDLEKQRTNVKILANLVEQRIIEVVDVPKISVQSVTKHEFCERLKMDEKVSEGREDVEDDALHVDRILRC